MHDRRRLVWRALVQDTGAGAGLCPDRRGHDRRCAAVGRAGAGAEETRARASHQLARRRAACCLARHWHPGHPQADGPGPAGRWRGQSVDVDQHPDCLPPGTRQRELDHLCRSPDGVPHRTAGRRVGCGADAATGSGARCRGQRTLLGHAGLGFATGGVAGAALRRGAGGLCQTTGRGALPVRRLQRARRATDNDGVDGLWRRLARAGGDQGVGTGLLRQPGHQDPGAGGRRCAGDHATAQSAAGALVCPRCADAVDWPGCHDQRPVAAAGPAQARQLQT